MDPLYNDMCDSLLKAREEVARLRLLLKEIKETAVENVQLCQRGHSQVAEEWCYELAELEY